MVSNPSSPNQSNDQANPIIDPWDVSDSPKNDAPPHLWHLVPEAHPLMFAATPPEGLLMQEGDPNALRLPPPPPTVEPNAAEILLQDELKLGATQKSLGDRIRDALALLWWNATGKGNPV